MSVSNGGISQLARLALFAATDIRNGQQAVYSFDPSQGFNDPANPSSYSFRVEDVITGRTPTISELIVTYRDLGLVTVTFSLTGTQDKTVITSQTTNQGSASVTVQLGNKVPTNRLLTKFIALSLSAQNLQLTITRAAGAGALSIAKVRLCGKVEDQKYAG